MERKISLTKTLLWVLILFNGVEFVGAFVLRMDYVWIVLCNTFLIIGALVGYNQEKNALSERGVKK